ncbi:MAG: HAMP domain-containing histidine kinase [Oscillospiraceae bacterium]|jgi:signal transduction histidine kinase|nr:HAMP domain-containing histidine kinase [Oscillospiraceae bacterium]
MERFFNLTVLRKLAIAGSFLCVPAWGCAVAALVWDNAPWYLFAVCLLISTVCGIYLFCLHRDGIVQPLRSMHKRVDALLDECTGEKTPKGSYDFPAILDGLDHLRFYLREARGERERYEENRKDVIAGISHDIGTPLAAILGCAEALLDGIPQTPEQERTYLETIQRKSVELSQLANDFFMFSCLDMENLPLHFESVRFEDFFEPLLSDISQSFNKNNINFDVVKRGFSSNPITLVIDPVQLGRVFHNLTNNCIKYMQRTPDTEPEARFSAEHLPDKRLRLTIESNGLPVSREDCGRIFTPYFRTNGAKTSTVNGSGIGLTVCKQLLDLLGGTICARPSDLGGLAIEVTFPLAEPMTPCFTD